MPDKPKQRLSAVEVLGLATYVGSFFILLSTTTLAGWRFWTYGLQDVPAIVIAAVLLVLTIIPLQWTDTPTFRRYIRWTCRSAGLYFPVHMIVEDAAALQKGKSYLLGLEPHSALPLGIPVIFASPSPLMPEPLQGTTHGLASSICFRVPLVRQLWWGLGLRPVTRHWVEKLLSTKTHSAVLCPGGVQEILYMEHGSEVMYLTKRFGFVRLAMKHGAPLVPVFVFGQTDTYSWWKPGPPWVPAAWVAWMSRQLGAVPLAIWGRWGTPIPHARPMHCVVGKPIPVPHIQDPSNEQVAEYLKLYIDGMVSLVEKHKAACGYPNLRVRVM